MVYRKMHEGKYLRKLLLGVNMCHSIVAHFQIGDDECQNAALTAHYYHLVVKCKCHTRAE